MAKLDLNRVSMPKQKPEDRAKNFNEVAFGYTDEHAMAEANRCIQCPKRPCVDGCPVGVDIPDFIKALREGDMPEAVRVLKSKNSLSGICGRVCPQESQCEAVCTIGKKGAPIAIGRLERYVSDWDLAQGKMAKAEIAAPTGKRVAVIGSGPASLTAAADLAKMGHEVTILEALHTAGGVLMYGIPEFRLPKRVVQAEVEFVRTLGVEIRLDSVIGKIETVDELLDDGYDAVFLGTGAGLPMFLSCPGENFSGVYSANEFLTRTNLMKAYTFPEYDTPLKVGRRVAVIGGGNVAMDSARCALRMGAEEVYIVYRRSEAELPARREEVENAQEEGVVFTLLNNPVRFIGDGRGNVKEVELIRMELGEPDDSGRRRPKPIPGTEWRMPVDTVVIAIGQSPNPIIQQTTEGLEVTRWGTIIHDEETMATTIEGVYTGGDVATGAATVISAMGAGRKAAQAMHQYLQDGVW